MINARLTGGEEGQTAHIGRCGELSVVVHPYPPIDKCEKILPFRQYFSDTGIVGGSIDMRVNGSVNAVDFYIEASEEYDIYIKYLSAEIGDNGSPALNKFGALSALTNGVAWYWFSNEIGEYELHEGIKTNKEFVKIGTDTAAIGTGVEAFLADVSGGGTEKAYLPRIDIAESFGMPWGLNLAKGSKDKMIFRVQDNLTSLITFNIVAYGIRI